MPRGFRGVVWPAVACALLSVGAFSVASTGAAITAGGRAILAGICCGLAFNKGMSL